MGIASDVKALGKDIVASYDTRVKWVGDLVKDTHKMLKEIQADNKVIFENVHNLLVGFQTEHKEMSENLMAGLAKGEIERLKEFKPMIAEIKKFVANMVEVTATLMRQIQGEQKERNKGVADLLVEFAKNHEAMADELRKSLAKGEKDRLEDFKPMMAGIQKYVADVVEETKRLIKEIQARQDERNKEVLDVLESFKTEREAMAANWQALVVTMEKKRGGMPVKIEAKQEVKTVEEAVKVEPKAKPKAEPKPKTPEAQILALLKKHPEGMSLPDLGNEAGCHFIKLTSPMRDLLDKDKVRKEDNLYFIA